MDKQILIDLILQNHSTHSIAKNLKVSQTKVRYWLNKYDLKTNTKSCKIKSCKNCNGTLLNNQSIYCNSVCHNKYKYEEYIKNWKLDLNLGYSGKTLQLSNPIRTYMLLKNNNSCQDCGWNKLHPVDNKPLVEIDHIDGDASNCKENNLRVLCPNCHSMTPTFRARNKSSLRDRT